MNQSPRLLIIRAVSLQQLDKNLPAIQAAYPNHLIHVLTHAHAADAVAKYQLVDHVHTYQHKGGFRWWRRTKLKLAFDVVIVPVGNLSAAGFDNVLLFASGFKARRRIICNLVSELRPFSATGLSLVLIRNVCFRLLALLALGLLLIPTLLTLPLVLKALGPSKA